MTEQQTPSANPPGDGPEPLYLPQLGRAYDLEPVRERSLSRGQLMFGFLLFLIFGGTVAFALVNTTKSAATWKQTKELLDVIIPVEATLLGAVIGYYFALERESRP